MGAIELREHHGTSSNPIEIPPKHRALLAYLALVRPRGTFLARDTLAGLFWPEHDQEHARSNLRKAVYEIRRLIGPATLLTRGKEEIGLDRDRFWCDAVELDESLAGDNPGSGLDLYRGELLPGMHLSDSAEFERWLEDERAATSERVRTVIRALAEAAKIGGKLAEAARWHRRALEVDPYDETTLCKLMDVRARLGDRAGAVKAYEAFAARLSEDLDLEPTEETREMAEAVRTAEADQPVVSAGLSRMSAAGAAGVAVTGVPAEVEPPGPLPWIERVSRRALTGALAVVVVLGVAGLYAVVGNRGEGLSPPVAIARAAPGIAVLPFTVRGEGLEIWREGMVDLLSTGLDGAANLRAISSRTVLARWQERVSEAQTADLSTTLAVASAAGARYALVGSAVAIGTDVRLVIDVYDIDTEDRLGQAQVEGRPDDVLALCDRLGVEALAIILEKGEGEIAPINLVRVMSDTTAALRAYLEGEVALRHFDLTTAEEAYQRAVDADSMFALAHFRLASVLGWENANRGTVSIQRHREHLDRAAELADRLPKREAMLVRARRALSWGMSDGVEALRQGVRDYPDDAEVWFHLGDHYFHLEQALATTEEVMQAFERAVELDPGNARNLYHLVGLTIDFGDSTQAANLVARYHELSPDTWSDSLNRLFFALAYGDSKQRATAESSLDTLDIGLLWGQLLSRSYQRHLSAYRALADAVYRNGDEAAKTNALFARYWLAVAGQGHLQERLGYMKDPVLNDQRLAWWDWFARSTGYPVSDEAIESYVRATPIDSTTPNPFNIFVAGTHAADRQRWADHRAALREFQRRREVVRAHGDSLGLRFTEAMLQLLEGYGLWKRGQPAEALPHIEGYWWDGPVPYLPVARFWLGEVYFELGKFEDAERVFGSFRFSVYPTSQYRLGQIYEQLEEYDKARQSYEYFVEYWADADPELQPMVEEARQAVNRLENQVRS